MIANLTLALLETPRDIPLPLPLPEWLLVFLLVFLWFQTYAKYTEDHLRQLIHNWFLKKNL